MNSGFRNAMDEEEKSSNKQKLRRLRSVYEPYVEEEDKIQNSSDWVVSVNEFLEQRKIFESGRLWTIFRVRPSLLDVYKSAFLPKTISIGPLHRKIDTTYDHKMRYLLRLLGGKLGEIDNEPMVIEDAIIESLPSRKVVSLEDLVQEMKKLELKTRECYSETFDIGSDEFVNMMVIDGCFVVELLRLHYKFTVRQINIIDPIFTIRWMLPTLRRDLIMLENQLPFFVLEKLFEMTSLGEEPSLHDLAITFFDPLLQRKCLHFEMDHTKEYKHLLDVFRSTFIKITTKKLEESSHITKADANLRSASELHEAGVTFKKKGEGELIDIEYEAGVLQMPELSIDDNTVPLFLNFVAYEQCDEEAHSFFTNYFLFLDSLINTPKDVEILHNSGIINHVLGSDKDVANLINKLCREIVYDLDRCHLTDQMKGLNKYCEAYRENKWLFWWRHLIRTHFSSPWALTSLVAAIFLLLLTTAQTFYLIYSYYHPTEGLALNVDDS